MSLKRFPLSVFCSVLLLLISGAFVLSPAANSSFQTDISDYVQEGIMHFSKEELNEAITDFSSAISLNSKDYMAYYQRAKVYDYKNDDENAIADYTNAIKADPAFVLAYYYRGIIYQRQKNLEAASADYSQIIEKNLGPVIIRANAYNNRGIAYDKKGEFQKAIEDYNEAMSLAPDLIHVYYNRGCTYSNMGAYPLALSDFDKELGLHPKLFAAKHYKEALLQFQLKNYLESWLETQVLEGAGERVSPVFLKELDQALHTKKKK